MEQMIQFLRRSGMHPDSIDPDRGIESFRTAMQDGLGCKASSLMMLPAYINPASGIPMDTPVAVLDAGGTNLRVALVCFSSHGPMVLADRHLPMPGTQGALTWEAFLEELAQVLLPIAKQTERLGFCFSFPARITPETDGEVICFNKEVQVSGASGKLVCRDLAALLNESYGCHIKHTVLLNDTVATLLGGYAQADRSLYDSYLGFILGTGMNCCYVEPSMQMIINMEAGGYNGFPRGIYDLAVDNASANPGDHQIEKMVSGKYLGEIIEAALKGAAREGLFTEPCAEKILDLPPFDMSEVSALLAEEDGLLSAACGDETDRIRMRTLVETCVDRAAKMLAVMFTAILEQTDAGREKPACIVAEGSTFWKCEVYRKSIDAYLKALATEQRGRRYVFRTADNANLLGAAAAALF